jgi:hypothetical protein
MGEYGEEKLHQDPLSSTAKKLIGEVTGEGRGNVERCFREDALQKYRCGYLARVYSGYLAFQKRISA